MDASATKDSKTPPAGAVAVFGMRAPLVLVALLLTGCLAPAVTPDAPTRGATPGGTDAPTTLSGAEAASTFTTLTPIATGSAPGGYNLRIHEDRAYVATFTTAEGISVFDVSNPANPVHLGGIVGTLARSVDVLDWGARVGVALSTGTELEVWELTDPADPVRLASFPFGSHNVQVHPDAKVIYNARNVWDDAGGAMEIVNASDPDAITLDHVWRFPPLAKDGSVVHNQGCHDLTVWPDEERAYCAAYEQSLVLDISDPLNPEILTAITNPLITSHHTAFPILNHTVLLIGDEWLDNLVWGCVSHGLTALPDVPAGALWFYDLTTPTPQVLSYLSGPRVAPEPWFVEHGINAMCTSHNGMELGEGTGLLAYGWFDAGLALVDASDPRHPVLVSVNDYAGAVGDARWYEGHVYAADDQDGLTVFTLA